MNYLLDTNTIIYFLQKLFPDAVRNFINGILRENTPCFSVITEIELLCWKTTDQADMQLLQSFINDATVIELNQSIKLETAEIRKNHKIKLPDAIIAATALVENRILLTRNIADFKNIAGLSIQNPWDFE